ncbi:C-C motif chemokine 27b [Hypomesus transpacificus]|uniref:C-C motif chemokine 27b n=1 Tax=Hypomesus transpacificus TaxID=137520 RepID=UPI001F07DD92|nr:C-C motif chemokine 27b [Hypomesus transpacificus]
MDLRVFALMLCAGVWFADVQGAIPKCCVATSKHFPQSLLMSVERYEMQNSHGPCDIEALILYANGKKYCSDLRVRRILRRLKQMRHAQTDLTHEKLMLQASTSVNF